MVYWIVAFFNGFCNSINKMMNVKAGQVFGTANGALINYIEATFLSLALLFLTGKGVELSAENMARAPLWVYLGAVCGLLAMVLLIVGTLRTNVLLSSILTLVGNLGAAAVLDYLFYGIFSWYKIAGIALILLGTAWIEKTGQAAKQSADAE
ncbi:MAG: DMT family transporter [Oscillospiraceae bacterium]